MNNCESSKESVRKSIILLAAFCALDDIYPSSNQQHGETPNLYSYHRSLSKFTTLAVKIANTMFVNCNHSGDITGTSVAENYSKGNFFARLFKKRKDEFNACSVVDMDTFKDIFYAYHSKYLVQSAVSIIGGVTLQEIIKACTGQDTPVSQFLMFRSKFVSESQRNIIVSSSSPLRSFSQKILSLGSSRTMRNLSLRNKDTVVENKICDETVQKFMKSLKVLIVGAGAIGCEVLKNLVQMKIPSDNFNTFVNFSGTIYLADMDMIEKSNLNRQFLFR